MYPSVEVDLCKCFHNRFKCLAKLVFQWKCKCILHWNNRYLSKFFVIVKKTYSNNIVPVNENKSNVVLIIEYEENFY